MNGKIFFLNGPIAKLTFKEVEKAHITKHPIEVKGCVLCEGIKARISIKFLNCLMTYSMFIGGDCKSRWCVFVEPHIKKSIIDEISSCGIYSPKPGMYVDGD